MMPEGADIVVVDDDTSMSQAIERLFDAVGLTCRSFASAEDLLDSGTCASAGVLILDIDLPGISGLELLRQLKASGNAPPVILITGQDRPNQREQALRCGATAYFTKPFAGSELIQAARSHLPHARVTPSPEPQ
jgi:FixJ family two-component response regulator